MRIYRARKKIAKTKAYQVLKENDVDALPVKVKKIAKAYPNVKIRTYSWFADNWGISHEEVKIMAGSEDGCCYYLRNKDKYLILYNEKISPSQRVRWTIAHELGHYFLGHNKDSNRTILSRNDMSEEKYAAYELEADLFARNLLAPPEIIDILKPPNIDFVAVTCDLSIKAAASIYRYAVRGKEMNVSYRETGIIKRFSKFINGALNSKMCLECNTKPTDTSAKFCRICANDNLSREIYKMNKGESSMIYSSIELNAAHRAIVCPVCSNENPTGNYCKICSTYLINKCTGMSDEEILNDKQNGFLPLWHKHVSDCGALLDGDARYCQECNATSTFYALGYLPHWEEEVDKAKSNYSLQAVPDNGTPIEINDDDLPF